jgi:hypothetical protein
VWLREGLGSETARATCSGSASRCRDEHTPLPAHRLPPSSRRDVESLAVDVRRRRSSRRVLGPACQVVQSFACGFGCRRTWGRIRLS